MSDKIVAAEENVEVLTEVVEVDRFNVVDTDRARASVELKKMKADVRASAEAVKNLSVDVACKLLVQLGLQEYMDEFETRRIGIVELRGMNHEALRQIGIENALHRGLILEEARKEHRSDAPFSGEEGKPIDVRVKMGFGRLADINTVSGRVCIKLFVDLYWNDPRLIGVSNDHLPRDFMWFPDGYFYNSIDRTGENGGHLNEHEITIMDPLTGLLLRPMEMEITCSFNMNLRNFPFDENPIDFHLLQSEKHSAHEFVFAPAKDPGSAIKFFYDARETPEFDLVGYSLDFSLPTGGNGVKYSNLLLKIHARRRPLHHMWKSVLPLFLTTVFAFTVFFFEVDDLEARSNTAQTTLLTTVALMFVLAQELPKTNYLTRIDKYLVFCLSVQLGCWALTCAHILRDFDDPDELKKAEDVDYYCAAIIPGIYILGTLLAFAPPLVKWFLSTIDRRPYYALLGAEGNELEYYPLAVGRNIFF